MLKLNNLQGLALVLAVSLCAATVQVLAQEDKQAGFAWEAVKNLTPQNFDEEIKKQELAAVFFYAPWCGHCKRAKPDWEQAGAILAEDGIPLYAVDANEESNRPLAQAFGVQGFPTIIIIRHFAGAENPIKPTTYNGARDAASLVSGIKVFTGPATTTIDQAPEDLINSPAKDHTKVTVVAFVDDKDSQEAKDFDAYADTQRTDGYFYVTENMDIAKSIHEDLEVKPNTLVLYRHFDGVMKQSEKIGSQKDIEKFINANYAPAFLALNDLTQNIQSRVFAEGLGYNIFMYGNEADQDKIKAWASKIPERYLGKVAPTVIFEAKGPDARLAAHFGLKESLDLSVAMVDLVMDKNRFIMQESATSENIVQYIDDVLAGKVEPTRKSEEIPATNDEPVKVVVGKSFEQMVLAGKNVFLEVYAPWCGHCKALEPVYNELGEALEGDSDVVIAKLDGTQNDIVDDRFEVQGFPSLFFVDAEGKVTKYTGAREKDAMKDFIEDNKKPVSAKDSEGDFKEEI